MLGHYFTIAFRSLRRAPLTAAVNVVALALGLAAFVTAYGVVSFWDRSERHFANVDRIYVVTANLEARNGSIRTGVQPTTNRLYDENHRNFARVNQVSAALALVAIAMSIVGLFSMAVQVASRRLHELGVRKSVGARSRQIVAMLLAQFSTPVLIANVIAWPIAFLAAQQYLSVFSMRVALTPLPFVASLAATIVVACAVVGGQAWRAARVSPAAVLRPE